jgi:hypothetical protein
VPESGGIGTAGSLRIWTFEGRRSRFRAAANHYWNLNRYSTGRNQLLGSIVNIQIWSIVQSDHLFYIANANRQKRKPRQASTLDSPYLSAALQNVSRLVPIAMKWAVRYGKPYSAKTATFWSEELGAMVNQPLPRNRLLDLSAERADRNDESQDENKVVQEIAKSVPLKLDGRWYEPDSAICVSHLNLHTGSPPTLVI